MRQELTIDRRVALFGSKKDITEAEQALTQSIPQLDKFSEPEARVQIQDCIDSQNLKADILFDGNSVWSQKRIVRDIKQVKKHGMQRLSDHLYKFLSLSCGSIAHYDKQGWIECYPTIEDLRRFFRKNEFGQRVLDYLPQWETDADRIVKEIEQVLGVCSSDRGNGSHGKKHFMKELKFVCPKCGHNELGSVEQVILTYPITQITDDGEMDYDYVKPSNEDGQILAFQCMNCSYELTDEQGSTIHECSEVVEWIKKNVTEKQVR